MVQTITPHRPAFYRTEVKQVLAMEVQEGDVVLGMTVVSSEPDVQRYIWLIKGIIEVTLKDGARIADAGFELRITEDYELPVSRTRQVGENECRKCGRLNVKYSARHLCNTCYQQEYREKQRVHARTG